MVAERSYSYLQKNEHAGFWDWEDIGAQSGAGLAATGGQKREGEGEVCAYLLIGGRLPC